MNINFELYKVFYQVAKHLSFSQAAENLFVSQSAVSQAVKSLEREMNCPLFIRTTKQVKLTPEGEVLFNHVEQAVNLLKAGERNISDIHAFKRGEIRIGASDTICKYYLLDYVEKFHSIYPQIKIKITNRTSPKCIDLLKKGEVDFAVINLPSSPIDPRLLMKKVRTIQDVFIAGRKFDFLRGRKINLQELADYPLLMLEKNSVTREYFDRLLNQHQISAVPEIELSSIDLLVDLTKIGLGISFVPQEYVDKAAGQGIFVLDLHQSIPSRSIGVITDIHLSLSTAAQKFIELLEYQERT